MRRVHVVAALLAAILVLALLYALDSRPIPDRVPVAANTVVTRMEVLKPIPADGSYVWQPMACDGKDVLSGVGDVRVMGFATWTGTRTKTNNDFRVIYQVAGASWYVNAHPPLSGNREVNVFDVVQDLTPTQTSHLVKFKDHICRFTAHNIPPRSEGITSHRTTPTDLIEGIRIALYRYKDDTLIRCGATVAQSGRVRVRVFVKNDATSVLDLHFHQERPAAFATGPSQEGDPATRRWWEVGVDDVPVTGGAETPVLSFVADTGGAGKNTFHAAQQHPTHQHDVETFCSFTNGSS